MTSRTGKTNGMAPGTTPAACSKCGAALSEGIMLSSDGLFFMPHKQETGRFGLRKTVRIAQARACTKCGYVELCLNPDELKAALLSD
jgi:predicted Zn-ribbon and HTH transcriptional regulator